MEIGVKSGGTTQTRNNERSLRSSRAGVVKVSEFSSEILPPQTTSRDEPQCRGTIRNVFEVQTKACSKPASKL